MTQLSPCPSFLKTLFPILKFRFRSYAHHGGEVEATSLTRCALQPNLTIHQMNQPAADSETQPRASELPRGRSIGLGESFEDEVLILRVDSDSGVPNLEVKSNTTIGRLL